MKSLELQIEFIDKKLLCVYGFKNIMDYSHTICISGTDLTPIDLNKLNGLIDEFRKIFPAKNFSLHKTEYKILTASQAFCLLKTCFDIASIPYDVSFKKKKRYLRLISKNNILDKYINTLKMAENGTFEENANLHKFETNTKKNYYKEIKNIEEFEFGGNKFKTKFTTITKEQLNNNIKKITEFEYYLSPKKILKYEPKSNSAYIELNLNDYGLNNKTLKSFCVNVVSKTFGEKNAPIILESFINSRMNPNTLNFKFISGQELWSSKFINGTNCLVDNVIIPLGTLLFHKCYIHIENIVSIMDIMDFLELKISGECVEYYSNVQDAISSNNISIEQQMCVDNKYNILRIMCGLAGMAYGEFLNYDKFAILNVHQILKNSNKNLAVGFLYKPKEEIINESELFIGKECSINISFPKSDKFNLTGFEITEKFKNVSDKFNLTGFEIIEKTEKFKNVDASKVFDYFGYRFVYYNKYLKKNVDKINYKRTINNKNLFEHLYNIYFYDEDEDDEYEFKNSKLKYPNVVENIEINFEILNKFDSDDSNDSNYEYIVEFIQSNSNIPLKYTIEDAQTDSKLKNKQNKIFNKTIKYVQDSKNILLINDNIQGIQLKIISKSPEEPIGKKYLDLNMKIYEFYSELNTDLRKLQTPFISIEKN